MAGAKFMLSLVHIAASVVHRYVTPAATSRNMLQQYYALATLNIFFIICFCGSAPQAADLIIHLRFLVMVMS